MTNDISPYEELVEKVDYLIKAYDRLNQKVIDNTEQIEFLLNELLNQKNFNLTIHEKQLEINKTAFERLDKMYKSLEKIKDEISKIEKKFEPENPGDINHLYQNWD